MKKIHLYGIVFIGMALFSLTSCSKKSSGPSTTAKVMFVNGLTNSTTVDFYLNNTKIPGASTISFLKYSGLRNIAQGSQTIGCELTGQSGNSINTSYNFTTDSNYSVFAAGIVGINSSASLLVTTDDLAAPTSGYAKVRLINLSSDTLNANLYIGSSNTALISSISSKTYSGFYQVAAGTNNIVVSDPSQPTRIIPPLSSEALASGKIYTFIITGTYGISTGTGALALTVIPNN